MERRLTEERITKAILKWLEKNSWEIICFDFPQSGTGVILHSGCRIGDSKNKDSIIPDIVAIKNEVVIFFENKDRFYLDDFKKIETLRTSKEYEDSIKKLLKNYKYDIILYGIGIPNIDKVITKSLAYKEMTDFIVCVKVNDIEIIYTNRQNLFF